MTCIACLRILPDLNADTPVGAAPLSARRAVAAFLVSHWSRPRRFGEIAPGVFLLQDPAAVAMDVRVLASLAAELVSEPVTLALMEGDQDSATLFAAIHFADLRSVLAGTLVVEAIAGRIGHLTPEGVCPVPLHTERPPLRLIVEPVPTWKDAGALRATG